jgi:hypothetical protein
VPSQSVGGNASAASETKLISVTTANVQIVEQPLVTDASPLLVERNLCIELNSVAFEHQVQGFH